MRRICLLACILCLCLGIPSALAEAPTFDNVPAVIRPGKAYTVVFTAPPGGDTVSLWLADGAGQVACVIFQNYPIQPGANTLHWDGLQADGSVPAAGEYRLCLALGAQTIDTPLRIGAPYPLITQIGYVGVLQSGGEMTLTFTASEKGIMEVSLRIGQEEHRLANVPVAAGVEGQFTWDGMLNGSPVAAGSYRITLQLRTDTGEASMQQAVPLEVTGGAAAAPGGGQITIVDITPAPTVSVAPTPSPTPEPPKFSEPYSSTSDGSYWSMTPGETDDAVIWKILMQPITIYDGVGQKEHAYLMENGDGSGKRIAQLHGKSQGVHVIGSPNEHGYVLVEAFSNYDSTFLPKTDDEKAHAFDLKQGYVKASGLKQVEVQKDIALLIDKLTQRLYIFRDGKRVAELKISTGIIENGAYEQETIAGEFITVSHTGGFPYSKYVYCDMAIRINGGTLLHEVPHEVLRDGGKRFKEFEAVLGEKASHGCVRIQREETEDGYSHTWLWKNLKGGAPYKVIIWDDLNRVDTPVTWQ